MAPISLPRYLPRLRRLFVRDEALDERVSETSSHWLLRELGGPLVYLAPLVWALTFLLPSKGLGISFCLLENMTGRCCPGCGLTRSFIAISHLDFMSALHYHPFGLAGYAIMALLSVFCFLPRYRRMGVLEWLDARRQYLMPSLITAAAAFCLYGLWRFVAGVEL